jgi:hypothetical protein
MSSEDEVRLYLRFLLDHREQCALEVCSSCRALQNVCESFGTKYSLVRQRLNSPRRFGSV